MMQKILDFLKKNPKPVFSALLILFLLLFHSLFSFFDTRLADFWFFLRIASQQPEKHPIISKIATLFPKAPPPDQIQFVRLDDQSYLGISPENLFTRRLWAKAADYVAKGSPKALGFNIFWGRPSIFDSEQDKILTNSISQIRSKTVIAGYRQENLELGLVLGPPLPQLAIFENYSAPYFYPFEERVRKLSIAFFSQSSNPIPGFSTDLARIYLGIKRTNIEYTDDSVALKTAEKTIKIPTVENEYMSLNYCIPLSSFKTISISDIFYERIPPETFKDKIVIFGVHNSTEQNESLTPLGEPAPSSLIHALAVYNILNQNFIHTLFPGQGTITAIFFVFLSLFFLAPRFNPKLFSSIAFGICIILPALSCYFLAWFNICFGVSGSIFAVLASLTFSIGQRFYQELSEKLRIRNAFQHYVTSSVVNEILKDPSKLVLHGEERYLTIFFSDIAGFTTLAEGMPPMKVVELLNEYLTEMTEIIFKYDGLLDKYEGDAIMSVFGAPIDQTDHAIRACRCALGNQAALKRLRGKWKTEGRPELTARIGINTGMVVVGNMGSKMRFDYTVIGDNVNLAARLEPANKIFGSAILIGETTASLAQKQILSRKLGILQVTGRKQGTDVYEVLGDLKNSEPTSIEKMLAAKDSYEKAYEMMLKRDFKESLNLIETYLEKIPNDKPMHFLRSKIENFSSNPPSKDWDGSWIQEQK
ncbi:MAG: adenylate/guanylate cyclase domain-containing protein [Candidatus Riflebacteria bacterium]|nr:adenylate/guanylate cyclase domain-containing protein [Candidatus Riflebacteria bacterium]